MAKLTEQAEWRKGCASGTCVEVAKVADQVLVRDSKNPDVVLSFSPEEWDTFLDAAATGEFRF